MELASGCSGGTLMSMGAGVAKSWIAIIPFIIGATVGAIDPVFQWSTKLPAQKEPVVVPLFVSLIVFAILFAVFFASEYFKGKRKEMEEPATEFSLRDAQVLITTGHDEDFEAQKQPLYRLKRVSWYIWIS
jgi:uncharacterized membrane protein YedE/YeeE